MATTLTDLIYKTYGSLLVGTLVASFLSGMNTLQTVVYFRVYPEDTMGHKALVGTIWGLDIIHSAFLWSNLWFYLITIFGQVSGVDAVQKPYIIPAAVVVTTTMILLVHMFYAQRIFYLSHRNYWITTPIVILVLCEVAGTLGAVIILYGYQDMMSFINSGYKWIFSPGFILAAVSDIVIMVVLLVLLRSSRQHSISLNNALDQLILYTFETGILTAFMAIAIMITWLNEHLTEIYLGLYVSLPKVYATTLLGLYYLRRDQGSQNGQGHNTVIRFANPVGRSESTNRPMLSMQSTEASTGIQHQHVNIDVTKSVWFDDEINTGV